MSGHWASSDRSASLPPDWPDIRRQVLNEEPACRLAYADEWVTKRGIESCAGRSVEVDHIDSPIDHSRANLRGVCTPCHKRRTQEQAVAALRGASARANYPQQQHPGMR